MKIKSIETGKDKNDNPLKIVTTEDDSKVWVNSKYEGEIYETITGESEIELVKDGNFWKIKPESLGLKPKAKGGSYIKQAMEQKQNSIKGFQETKQDSIRMSSACRDATLITVELIKNDKLTQDTVIKQAWSDWRKWFYERSGDEPQSFSEPFS